MKQCTKCNVFKSKSEFNKNLVAKDGLQFRCIPCKKEQNKQTYLKNGHLWKSRKNIDGKQHYVQYKEHYMNKARNRLRNLEMRTPQWANEFFINEAYDLARLRTQMLGTAWHVDHIIPLQGKNVCGLHVEYNLQVIPAKENLKKSNKFLELK
jgi:5-methylcytosine-specific restriction endonuclease McrA